MDRCIKEKPIRDWEDQGVYVPLLLKAPWEIVHIPMERLCKALGSAEET